MKYEYPILYSKNTNGKPIMWQIIVEDDTYYTIAGQLDGKKTISEPTKCTGKNKGKVNQTTDHEQALLDAKSKWTKRLKLDYHESLDEIDNIKFFEPMLAKKLTERMDKVTFPALVDIKFNGGRIIAKKDGLFTRKGERYVSIPHIEQALKPFFEKYPNAVLDGEGYCHNFRHELNETMSLLRKTKKVTPSDLSASKDKIRYYIYDGINFADVDTTTKQIYRRNKLIDILHRENIDFVEIVKGQVVYNFEQVWELYNSFVDEGYEGAMVRLDAPYSNGRTGNLLKVKPEDDDEGIVVGIVGGSGNWANKAKKFEIEWYNKQSKKYDKIQASLVCTFEEGEDILRNPDNWLEKEVKFLYNGFTGLGTPNFARVDINNCDPRK